MGDSRILQIIIDAKNNTEKEFAGINKQLNELKPMFKEMALVGGAIFGALSYGIKNTTDAYRDQAKADAKLRSGLESTKNAAGITFDELVKQAQEFQRQTLYGDEAVQDIQAQLLTFKNISKDSFQQATESVLDMATKMGREPISVAIMLGKALNDPVKNMEALSRNGVQFTEQQKEEITTLIESGKLLEAQKIMLGELSFEFGGTAKAVAEADGGITQLNNIIGDLKETIGESLIPIIADFTKKLKPAIEWVSELIKGHEKLVGISIIVATAIAGITMAIGILGLALPAIIAGFGLLLGPIGAVIGIITAAGVGLIWSIKLIKDNWWAVGVITKEVWDVIKEVWDASVDWMSDKINSLIGYFSNLIAKIREALSWFDQFSLKNIGQSFANLPMNLGFGGGKAVGGPVSAGTSYLVGENGPEFFTPGSSGMITPNNRIGGGNTIVNITVNGDITGRELIEKVKDSIMGDLSKNMKLAL